MECEPVEGEVDEDTLLYGGEELLADPMGDAEANDELLLANEDAIEEDSIDDKSGSNDATLAAVEPPSSDSGDVVDLDVGEDIIEPESYGTDTTSTTDLPTAGEAVMSDQQQPQQQQSPKPAKSVRDRPKNGRQKSKRGARNDRTHRREVTPIMPPPPSGLPMRAIANQRIEPRVMPPRSRAPVPFRTPMSRPMTTYRQANMQQQQQQRFGDMQPRRFNASNPAPAAFYPKAIHFNPNFRGSIQAESNVRISWDQLRLPGPAASNAGSSRPTTRPLQQQQRPPMLQQQPLNHSRYPMYQGASSRNGMPAAAAFQRSPGAFGLPAARSAPLMQTPPPAAAAMRYNQQMFHTPNATAAVFSDPSRQPNMVPLLDAQPFYSPSQVLASGFGQHSMTNPPPPGQAGAAMNMLPQFAPQFVQQQYAPINAQPTMPLLFAPHQQPGGAYPPAHAWPFATGGQGGVLPPRHSLDSTPRRYR